MSQEEGCVPVRCEADIVTIRRIGREKAATLGLKAADFASCLDSGKMAGAVSTDLQVGSAVGVNGTPAIFVNGRMLSGAQPYEAIAKVIDEELKRTGGAVAR